MVNTTAVELGLGTGGWHVVHWNLERDDWSEPGPGHIIKGRYTSLQADVGSTEEHLEALAEVDSIDGMPVVVAALHSQLPAVAAAFKDARARRPPRLRDDRRRRPAARAVRPRRRRCAPPGSLDATVTCGHAFGGDYEAVSVFSALAVARHVAHADAAVVVMGPGIVGTNTRLGFSGMEVGPILDAAHALGGVRHRVPAGLVRRRPRPSRRALAPQRHRAAARGPRAGAGRGARRSPPEQAARLRADLAAAGIDRRHDLVDVDAPDALALFARHGLRIVSMGRPAAADPALFQAAAAAGALAART